jgi:hypothetical protein
MLILLRLLKTLRKRMRRQQLQRRGPLPPRLLLRLLLLVKRVAVRKVAVRKVAVRKVVVRRVAVRRVGFLSPALQEQPAIRLLVV